MPKPPLYGLKHEKTMNTEKRLAQIRRPTPKKPTPKYSPARTNGVSGGKRG